MMRERLANGMEYVLNSRSGANVVSIQCVVWAGSLDENKDERGVAHFLEHMLFKGTENRGVGQIASLVEGAGGDINAYTTFDKTVYYLTLPSEQAELGFDILSDAIFQSTFVKEEFEREREVILEEIRRGNDDPGGQIGRKIFSEMYEGSEAGRPIIGFSEEVKNFSRDTLVGFWKKWYQPKNMSLVVVGNISREDAKTFADKHFGDKNVDDKPLSFTPGSGRHGKIKRKDFANIKTVVISGDFEQTRMDVAVAAPAIDSPECPIIDTVSYILGGSDVSRLQRRLKENEAIVNAVGASAYTPSFEGIFEVSAALDPENYYAAIKSIGREMALLMGAEPATQQELDRSRAASRIGRIHREETVDGVARAVVSGLSTPMKEKFEGIYDKLLNEFKCEEVTEVLNREWNLDTPLILVLCDKNHVPDEEKLKASFLEGVKEGRKQTSKQHQSTKNKNSDVKMHKFEIGGGLKALYRHIPDAKMFSIAAATEGGLRGEDISTVGTFHAMATLLGLATKTKDYEKFSGRLEDMGTVLGGFSGKDSLGFEMHCTVDQVEEMIHSLGEAMLEPQFPELQWESYRRETLESLKLQQDSPSWICMRRLHQEVYGNHTYALPVSGIEKTVKEFSAAALQKTYEDWRDGGPWVFAIAGGVDPEKIVRYLQNAFSTFKPQKNSRKFHLQVSQSLEVLGIPLRPRRKQEQAHIALAGHGPKWGDGSRAAVDVLVNILGGHGGRLFTTLRDQESLAYSVSPLHSQGMAGGMIGAYIATATDKVEQALSGLKRELLKMANEGPTADEVVRAKSYILGSHVVGLQRTSAQAMTMALMELYGMGWDDFEKYPDYVKQVGNAEIKNAARELFNPSAMKSVVVG